MFSRHFLFIVEGEREREKRFDKQRKMQYNDKITKKIKNISRQTQKVSENKEPEVGKDDRIDPI